MRPEYTFIAATEEKKCIGEQESDFQNAAFKSEFLIEVILHDLGAIYMRAGTDSFFIIKMILVMGEQI